MTTPYQYIFGPVQSWRLGRSLGIDPLSSKHKICNMNCVYCQLGSTSALVYERSVYVPTQDVLDEISRVPLNVADHITFAGRGEPTLAKNLGEMIRGVKSLRSEKVAILTNSSLFHLKEVRQELLDVDFVLAKLDGSDQDSFESVDKGVILDFEQTIQGIMDFRQQFKGKLALQMMLVEENIKNVEEMANISRRIGADEIQLDTPLRPSAVKPLERKRLESAKKYFEGMSVVSVYDVPLQEFTPIDERATMSRHGNYRKTQLPT